MKRVFRKAATFALAFCLAAWIAFSLDLAIAFVHGGTSGVAAEVLHLAGETRQFGIVSLRAAVARLAALLLITVGFGFLRHLLRTKEAER